jgi:hypothetical protein
VYLPVEHVPAGQCLDYDGGYYGTTCDVYCDPWSFVQTLGISTTSAAGQPPFVHAMCDATGNFTCLRDVVRGYWDGPTCDVCLVGWRGDICNKECLCNGHGGCGRYDGICSCFRDDTNGYWDGVECSRCLAGYGPVGSCVEPQGGITRDEDLQSADSLFREFVSSGASVNDPAYQALYQAGRPLVISSLDPDYSGVQLLHYLCLGQTTPDGCINGDLNQGFINSAVVFPQSFTNAQPVLPSATAPFAAWRDFLWFGVTARPHDYICRMYRDAPAFNGAILNHIPEGDMCGSDPTVSHWCCQPLNATGTSQGYTSLVAGTLSEHTAFSFQSTITPTYQNRIFYAAQAFVGGNLTAVIIPVWLGETGANFTVEPGIPIIGMEVVTGMSLSRDRLRVRGTNALGRNVNVNIPGAAIGPIAVQSRRRRRMQTLAFTATTTDEYEQLIRLGGSPDVVCQYTETVLGVTTTYGTYACTFVEERIVTQVYNGAVHEWSYRFYHWAKPGQNLILVATYENEFDATTATTATKMAAMRAVVFEHPNADVTAFEVAPRNPTAANLAATPPNQEGSAVFAVNAADPSVVYKLRLTDLAVTGYQALTTAGSTPEIVNGITLDHAQRVAYLGLSTSVATTIQILLFSVSSMTPQYVDVEGDVLVNVTGDEFYDPAPNNVLCKVGNYNATVGTYISPTTLQCRTPTGIVPKDSCVGEYLEVALMAQPRFTQNQKQVIVTPKIQLNTVSPTFAKSDTATEIALGGFGFVDSAQLQCVFSFPSATVTRVMTPAKYIDYRNITCVTPTFHPDSSSLMANTVEVTVDGQKDSSSANIQFDLIGRASHIEGWIQQDAATRFYTQDPANAANTYEVKVATQTLLPIIKVALFDGTFPCGALSAATCHQVPYNDYIQGNPADPSKLAAIVTAKAPNGADVPVKFLTPPATSAAFFVDGVATFDQLCLGTCDGTNPDLPGGVYTLKFNMSIALSADTTVWTFEMPIKVTPGDPFALSLGQGTMDSVNQGQLLDLTSTGGFATPLEVYVKDIAGNQIFFSPAIEYQIALTITVMRFPVGHPKAQQTSTSWIPDIGIEMIVTVRDGKASFTDFVLDAALRGIMYRVNLRSVNDPTMAFTFVYANPALCPKVAGLDQYGVYGRPMFECQACPAGGICDGTHYVQTQEGWWRELQQTYLTGSQLLNQVSSPLTTPQATGRALLQREDLANPNDPNIYIMYQCRDPKACAGIDLNSNGTRFNASCTEGHEGNLCSVCKDGYGQEGATCRQCPDIAVSVVFVIIYLVIFIAVVAVLVYAALEDNKLFGKHNSESRYISVILKLLWNHMQMVVIVVAFNLGWEQYMQELLYVVSLISTLEVNFRTFNCLFNTTFFSRLIIYVVAPAVGLLLTVIIFGAIWYYKRSHGKPTFLREKIVTSNVVIVFLLYPTVLRECCYTFMCRTLYKVKYLEIMPSVNCYTSDHNNWILVSAIFIIIYGLALPVTALIILFKHERDQTLASRECINSLGFLYRGYRRTRWYWEIVIHIRKMFLVAIITIGWTKPLLQAYLCLWVISIWLLLNIFFVPYSHEFTNRLENFSLATVFITINVGLLNQELLRIGQGTWATVLSIILMVLNVICIILFLWIFILKIKAAIYARFDVDGDGEITFKEVLEVLNERCFGKPRKKSRAASDADDTWARKDMEVEPKDAELYDERVHLSKSESAPKQLDDGADNAAPTPVPAPAPAAKAQPELPEPTAADQSFAMQQAAPPMYPAYPPPFIPGSVNMQPDWYGGAGYMPPDYSYYPQKPPPPMINDYPDPAMYAPPEKGKTVDPWYDQQPEGAYPPLGDYQGDYPPSLYESRDDDGESGDPNKPRTKLRVGLRAPENDERAKITPLTDLYGHSCRSVYLYYCKQYDTKPKPQVRLALPDNPNEFNMEDLILNETTLIGNRGLLPVLEVVRLNTKMKCLSVIGNGIKNTGVEWLVHMALDHPGLASIDLSDNRITNAAGTVLNYLAQRNPRIIDLNISNTRIDEQLKHHIELRLKANREQQAQAQY